MTLAIAMTASHVFRLLSCSGVMLQPLSQRTDSRACRLCYLLHDESWVQSPESRVLGAAPFGAGLCCRNKMARSALLELWTLDPGPWTLTQDQATRSPIAALRGGSRAMRVSPA